MAIKSNFEFPISIFLRIFYTLCSLSLKIQNFCAMKLNSKYHKRRLKLNRLCIIILLFEEFRLSWRISFSYIIWVVIIYSQCSCGMNMLGVPWRKMILWNYFLITPMRTWELKKKSAVGGPKKSNIFIHLIGHYLRW